MKATVFGFALIALIVGFTACAKYPVVVSPSASGPTAAAPSPTR
jgi:hypothetical protein